MRNPISWLEARRELCFECLRIYLGIGLFMKGALFAADPDLLASLTAEGRFDASAYVIAHYVVVAHLCGGAMLALGLLTRLAALVQLPVLAGAVFFVHMKDGLFARAQNLEFTLFVLFTLLLVAWHGPGRWSLDWVLFERPRRQALAAAGAPQRTAKEPAAKERTA
jgi:uncharacterized membrane protein YphA (DoxX/SURF4 family)